MTPLETVKDYATERLEYLRGEIQAERISMSELVELHELAGFIEPGDVELLEWAGVPEFNEEEHPENHEFEPNENNICGVCNWQPPEKGK